MTTEELLQLLGTTNIDNIEQWERSRESMRRNGLDPNNYYQEVEMTSPYVNTHSDITYSYEAMALHSHAFYEIIYCRSSCGAEYLVGSHRYALQKGDIILIRPGVSHCAILPDPLPIPYERDVIWLSALYLNAYAKVLGLPPFNYDHELPTYLIRTSGTPWEFLCDKIHEGVLTEKNKPHSWQALVLGNTMMISSYLRQAYLSKTVTVLKAETPDLLDKIIAYLDSNYRQRLTMSDVARHFFVSERTISTLLRKRLGVTFVQFLTRRRLVEAKSLILRGENMEDVAEKSGFYDYSTFYRAFKQEFGISPRHFKQMQESPKPELPV